ncbi:MAG: thermonuclease family protein [Candidatus Omnitrophica bacterium]|nr:thermonuclease family protein [Candidatus Omnitrophota bacterium]
MNKSKILNKILSGLFLTILCSCVPSYDYSHIRVTRVIDGDTVRLENGETLRYIGIDTPEIKIKQNNRFIYNPQPFSLEAKRLNEKLVKNKIVRIEFDIEKTDKYKRLLGYCFIENTLVNAKLVEEGVAVTYTIPPNIKYVDIFIKSQKNARQNLKGMWGVYETITADKAINHTNQIRTVKGKIVSGRRTKNGILLTLETSRESPFKVMIFNNSLKYFYQKNIDPVNYYREKVIEVSGRIRRYKQTAQIIVSSPEEISIRNVE